MRIFTKLNLNLSKLLVAVAIAVPNIINAQAYTLQNDDVEVNAEGYITSCTYDYSNKKIIIPTTLDAITVIGIETDVFSGNAIEEVQLPATIEFVRSKAFYNNNITSVVFEAVSNLRKIEALAFSSNSSLSSIILPTSAYSNFVKYFNERSDTFNEGDIISDFYRDYSAQITYSLTDADVTITDGVITDCSYDFAYTDIIIPNTLNAQTVVGIEEGSSFSGVFSDKGLTSVTIPTSMKSIGDYAFYDNDIFEVTFKPNSNILSIGDRAFEWNDLNAITLPTHAASSFVHYQDENGTTFNPGDQITEFDVVYLALAPYTLTDEDVVVTDGYIQSCSYSFENRAIVIPASLDAQTITGIADYAYFGSPVFYDKDIQYVQFPNTLEYIGVNSFASNSLTVQEIPASVKELKANAFMSNDLTQVTFATPSNIESVGANTFYNNIGVEITLPSSHTLGESVIYTDTEGAEYASGNVVTETDYEITAALPSSIYTNTIKKINVSVGPNPTSGAITITCNEVMSGVVEVYNVSGLLLKTIELSAANTQTSIDELPNGICLFKYQGGIIAKIVKK